MRIITAMVEGRLGDTTVGYGLTAGPETPEEVRAVMITQGCRAVEHHWPGVVDVRQTAGWTEIEVPDAEATLTWGDEARWTPDMEE